jgi:hypothetical protein
MGQGWGAQAPLPPLIPWSPSKNFCHSYFEEERLEDEDDDKLATSVSLNFHPRFVEVFGGIYAIIIFLIKAGYV